MLPAAPSFASHSCCHPPSEAELAAWLTTARMLQASARRGLKATWLRGRTIGLMSSTPDSDDAKIFLHAVLALGARVAEIMPSLTESSPPGEFERTARLLGRLYDAIECQGQPASLVCRIRQVAGVPVYCGLASACHQPAACAGYLIGDETPAQKRVLLLQAALIMTIG